MVVFVAVVAVVVGAIVGENQRFQIPGFAGEGSASTTPRARTGQPDAAGAGVGVGGGDGGDGMVWSMLDAIIFHRVYVYVLCGAGKEEFT